MTTTSGTLTHLQTLRECGKTLITTKESKQSKEQLENDIQHCFATWLSTHSDQIPETDDLLGFIFPQTATHESIVVSRVLATPVIRRKSTIELINDTNLKYVTKRTVETYQTCQAQKKVVAWTWPVIEMYIEQFYREMKETTKAPSPPKEDPSGASPKIRISSSAPRGVRTTSVEKLNVPYPAYVVVSFPIQDTILARMYNCLLDHGEIKEVLKVMRHENIKFKESILRNVTEQHQRQQTPLKVAPSLTPKTSSTPAAPAPLVPSVPSTPPPPSVSAPLIPQTPPPKQPPRVGLPDVGASLLPRSGLPELRYSECIAIQPKNKEVAPVEVKFEIKAKPAYSNTRITKENYLSAIRVKHMRANTEFESMLVMPMNRSITSHPFYLFLHNELQQCREQTYRSANPNAPLTRPNLRVGFKRKHEDNDQDDD